jgi:hypothetical protein
MRRAAKVDATHDAIVTALRAAGASVQSLAPVGKGCPDALVGYRGITYTIEFKAGRTSKTVKAAQDKWHSEWRGQPVAIAFTPDDALRAIGALA